MQKLTPRVKCRIFFPAYFMKLKLPSPFDKEVKNISSSKDPCNFWQPSEVYLQTSRACTMYNRGQNIWEKHIFKLPPPTPNQCYPKERKFAGLIHTKVLNTHRQRWKWGRGAFSQNILSKIVWKICYILGVTVRTFGSSFSISWIFQRGKVK